MVVMIHKIHRGETLPSTEDQDPDNDYRIVGFMQAIHDYTDVLMPPSHSTHIEAAQPMPYGPGLERDCVRCHQGTQADAWNTKPSRRGCFSCHDDIDLVTGVGHPLVPRADDADCVLCHNPEPANVDIIQRHSPNYDWANDFMFAEHTLEIVIDDVQNVVAGQRPEVLFTIRVDGAPFDTLNQPLLGALSFSMVGLNGMDYTAVPSPQSALLGGSGPRKADPAKVTAIDASQGKFRFTFPVASALPGDASGSFAFGAEAYVQEVNLTVSKPAAPKIGLVIRQIGNLAGTARRPIIDNARCETCHVELGFHGSKSRRGEQYCAICHNPNLDNRGRMRFNVSETRTNWGVPGSFVVESVDIGVMSHKIHMGEELSHDYRLGAVRTASIHDPANWPPESGGPAGAIAEFGAKAYPNRMGRCESCHAAGTWALPSGTGLLPVTRAILECGPTDPNGWCTGRTQTAMRGPLLIPRQTALCTSCHDSSASEAHAMVTTFDPDGILNYDGDEVETCSTCHGPGAVLDSIKVHRGVP
jgi:OmcA/MtrC family decaheme c-type cytochrome